MTRVPTHRLSPATSTTSTHDGQDWRERAACKDTDPDLWHAADHERANSAKPRVAAAKAICDRCPVTTDCLRDALNTRDRHGVRGGIDMATLADRTRGKLRAQLRTQDTPPAPAPKPKPAPAKRDPITRPSCGLQRGYEAHTAAGERQCATCKAWRARGKRAEAA